MYREMNKARNKSNGVIAFFQDVFSTGLRKKSFAFFLDLKSEGLVKELG